MEFYMASLTTSAPAVRPPAVVYRLASDARLARLAAAGRDGAMAAIFERHHQALHRYCYSILGNGHDAADALQNTMVKALGSLPGETREIALKPWLYRIAHNEAISLLRARRPDADLDAAAHLSDRAVAGAIESRERLRSLAEDLRELTERQRCALLMRELGGLEFTEVAEALRRARRRSSRASTRRAARCRRWRRAARWTVTRSSGPLRRRPAHAARHAPARPPARLRGCRAFELALHARPAQLNAMIPPLPLVAGAAMLHGIIGGGGGTGGGGLLAGLTGTAKAAGMSLGAKAAAVAAVGVSVGGGAVYAVPEIRQSAADDTPARVLSVPAAAPAVRSNVVMSNGTTAAGKAGRSVTGAQSAGSKRAVAGNASAPERSGSPGARGTAPAGGARSLAARARKPASAGSRKAAATSRRGAAATPGRSRSSTGRKPATKPAVANAAPVVAPGLSTAAGAPPWPNRPLRWSPRPPLRWSRPVRRAARGGPAHRRSP